uniref:Uncharacterized protein n=1 Tax=Noctiluca scintillans TaxID=2966 RepID=A0A7S1AZT0_NOCSC
MQKGPSSDVEEAPTSEEHNLTEEEFMERFLALAARRIHEEKLRESGFAFHEARLFRVRRSKPHGWSEQIWNQSITGQLSCTSGFGFAGTNSTSSSATSSTRLRL